jgi:hypothetical protein
MQRAALDGLVDRADEVAVRRVGGCVVAVCDQRGEPAEVIADVYWRFSIRSRSERRMRFF